MSLFEGRDLACRRGERWVFAALDFALPAGGALLLSGPNGSGKSSLLRLMAGLLPPASGSLLWAGEPLRAEPEAHRKRLHFLGHLDAVKPVLSARENLAFWAALRGVRPEPGQLEAALETFGLAALASVPARLLSAGQKRRLALSRLLAAPAELWLLDEPSVGLDSDSVAALTTAMAAHLGSGGRIVASSHLPLGLQDAESLGLEDFAATTAEPWLGADWDEETRADERPGA